MKDNSSKWLVETDWLAQHLNAPDLVVVDATSYPPLAKRLAPGEFPEHIPGAVFFDIDEIADTDNPLPHMLPSPEKFASRMRKMGIGDGQRIVAYDANGIVMASRVWWMFRVMGHDDVAVLNGGLPKWKNEGHPLETLAPKPRSERHFTARFNRELVCDFDDMRRFVAEGGVQIIDARSRERFAGTAPEPREVPRLGHLPGSRCVPYACLLNSDGTIWDNDELREIFDEAGIDLTRPVATTCGSGVTACVVSLALALIGHEYAAVYDGSWTEWSQRADAPIEIGMPRY